MPEIFFSNKHFHDLNPLAVGYQKCTPLFFRSMKKVDYYIIHYVLSGTGAFVLDGKLYKVKKNQAFIIPPNTSFFYQADEHNPWEYIWINFGGTHADQLLKLKTPIANINPDHFNDLLLCKNYAGQEADYLAGKLFLIIVDITKKIHTSNYIHMAKSYMSTFYSHNIKIDDLANNLGLNRKYLAKIFKKSTGMTMSEFLLDVRMRKASEAISNGEKNITAIAAMVGFEDPLFFSRQFKKHFGVSPTEFIKKHKKER